MNKFVKTAHIILKITSFNFVYLLVSAVFMEPWDYVPVGQATGAVILITAPYRRPPIYFHDGTV